MLESEEEIRFLKSSMFVILEHEDCFTNCHTSFYDLKLLFMAFLYIACRPTLMLLGAEGRIHHGNSLMGS